VRFKRKRFRRKFDGKSGSPMIGNTQARMLIAEFYGVSLKVVRLSGDPERLLCCKSDTARRILLGVSHKHEMEVA
jgi:hypothetical protein